MFIFILNARQTPVGKRGCKKKGLAICWGKERGISEEKRR